MTRVIFLNFVCLAIIKFFLNYKGFFHTVLLNSKFCNNFVNSNLKFVNWKREVGCVCNEVNNPVDWCGCSPNFLTTKHDLDLIKGTLQKSALFFARKFDPIHNNHLINIVDQSIFGLYSANFKSLNSYWHNIFDHNENTQLENKHSNLEQIV